MGLGLYLRWDDDDGKPSTDSLTAKAIYTNVSMRLERELLHEVFGELNWDGEWHEYAFPEWQYDELLKAGFVYLLRVHAGCVSNAEDASTDFDFASFGYAVVWLAQLIRFYELGMQKRAEGKHPKVRIVE